MTIISGYLREVVDLWEFAVIPQGSIPFPGTELIYASDGHRVQLITRARRPVKKKLKSGLVLELNEGPITEKTHDAIFNQAKFIIKLTTSDLEEAQDVQLVVRNRQGKVVYRSEQVSPDGVPTEPVNIYLIHDIGAKIEPLREMVEEHLGLDPFAGIDLPSDFGAHFFQGVAMTHLDDTTRDLVDFIEAGDFPGIGKQEIASTKTSLELAGNTFQITFAFSKFTKQLVRTNSGGPRMVPKKRFLTLELEGRVLVTDSLDPHRYATVDVLDINVKSKKALVIAGAPFAKKEKLIPPSTANAISNGIDGALAPALSLISSTIPNLATQHPLLGSLASYFEHGTTLTLTGFDTTPTPSRKAQLRPIAALGFPGNPFAT